jgi:ubiquinone/menaquinone biosynthesis C-methylase UbiE
MFEILGEEPGLFNLGQHWLCDRTVRNLPKQGKWLDVGCGIGGPACYFAGLYPELAITGINISTPQIEKARTRVATGALSDRVEVQFGDACNMPTANACFDGLFAIETALHYPQKRRFINEAFRSLKAGGRFALADMVFAENPSDSYRTFLMKLLHWNAGVRMYTASKWKRDLEQAGFVDIQIEDVSGDVFEANVFSPGDASLIKKRSVKWEATLRRDYPRLMIDLNSRGHDWLALQSRQVIRYVVIEAVKPITV